MCSKSILIVVTIVCFYSNSLQTNGQGTEISHQSLLDELEDLRNELREVARHVVELEMNPFPTGFIYIQYYGTAVPTILWPHSRWQEVTQNYAGLFFRAGGGNAASFGAIQAENTHRITNVERQLEDSTNFCDGRSISLPLGQISSWIATGSGMPSCGLKLPLVRTRFQTSGGEIRPRNQAFRMWQVLSHE